MAGVFVTLLGGPFSGNINNLETLILFLIPCRFGGEEFPPVVMFKVFIRVGSSSTKYMSGKNMIRAESEVHVVYTQ